jgi:hypothetical protein
MKKSKKRDKLAAFKIGFALSFTLQPFEVLRTRLILEKFKSKNEFSKLVMLSSKIFKENGILGFWKGSFLYFTI